MPQLNPEAYTLRPFNAAETLAAATDIRGAQTQNALSRLNLERERDPESRLNRARDLEIRGAEINQNAAREQLRAAQIQNARPQLSSLQGALGDVRATMESKGVPAARQRLNERIGRLQSAGVLPEDFELDADIDSMSDEDFMNEIEQAERDVTSTLTAISPQEAPAIADVEPEEYTPASVEQFRQTGDFSALQPREEQSEPSSLESKLSVVREALGRDLTESEILDAAGMSGEDVPERVEEEQIPPETVSQVIMPDGSNPEIGTTWGEAQEAGAKYFSTSQLNRKQAIEDAVHTLDRLEDQALGENGVFVDEGGSPLTNNVLGRLVSGISNGFGAMFGTEASESREIFDSTSRGTLSTLVRSLGESGALSEGDTQRAMELIPTLGATPDTERKAKAQFSELRTLLSRGRDNLQQMQGGGAGEAEFDYDPQTGRLVPREGS